MLTQLKKLSISTEGRYAQESELQFFHDYLKTVNARIGVYETIRDEQEQIDSQITLIAQSIDPKIHYRGDRNIANICRRDRQQALRCASAAMLFDDLDRLRNDYLMWDQKIIKAFADSKPAQITYQVMFKVIETMIKPEELTLIAPALKITQMCLN
ncbi:MAG: hypothetical protein N5P05_002153 [Chroococcopsis gigantea SAG 12.99]|jgi:hypothetical protein|nr:allophycocyanin [Chlorogloea purpurea SAG 13.99]MDV3000547.1 hypothetical protein [Chroococcopsis gigantea SAG 12.99]